MTRLLGIDLGERRIGLAVGDTGSGAARGLAVLSRSGAGAAGLEREAAALGQVAAEQRVGELVVGLPRNMDGTEGPQAEATRAWAGAMAGRLGLPVVFRDERLTSRAAEARLGRVRRGPAGGPPSSAALARRRQAVDREAARLILQAELDERAGIGGDAR